MMIIAIVFVKYKNLHDSVVEKLSVVLSVVISVLAPPSLKEFFLSSCNKELSQLIDCFKRSFLTQNWSVMEFIIT